MKLTKKRIVYTVLELLFVGGVPNALVIMQYSNIGSTAEAIGFRLSITGILLAILVAIICKKTFVDRKLNDLHGQINQMSADLKTESNSSKITNLETALKGMRTVEAILGAVLPILFLLAVIVACKALEAQLLELSGTVGLILVSYIIGTVFGVLAAREVVSKHKEADNGQN